MLTQKQTYFVTYKHFGQKHNVQIEANSHKEVEAIFFEKFDIACDIVKIQNISDISEEISENLMVNIREQFAKIKLHS